MEKTTLKDRIVSHYHWVVAVVVFLEVIVSGSFVNNLYSLYLIPITEDLGVSRGAFSISPSIRYLCAFCSNLMFGFMYSKFGYRKLAAFTLYVTAGVYLIYSKAHSLIPFYFGAAIVGFLEAFFSTASVSRVISEWFHRHRGLVLGIIMAATGIGSSGFSILMTAVMNKGSFRDAMVLSAIFLLVTAVLVTLFARNKPAQMGLKPMGEGEQQEKKQSAKRKSRDWDGFTVAKLKTMPVFYLQMVATFLFNMTIYAVYPSIISHAQDIGLSAANAALLHSAMFLLMAGSKIIAGGLIDWMGAKTVVVVALLCNIVSILILITANSFVAIFIALILFSLPMTTPTVLTPCLTAEQFGRQSYGAMLGIFLASGSVSGILASPILNFTYDKVGSYVPGYIGMAVTGCVSLALYLTAFRGVAVERKRMERANAE